MPFSTTLRGLFRKPSLFIYADFIDPFCYIGVSTLLRAMPANRFRAEWRGFEFNPTTPPEGWRLGLAANSDVRPGMWASVQSYAEKEGLTVREPRFIPNTRKAHWLVQQGRSWNVKKSLIERLYQAYFKDEKDIGDEAVLRALCLALGISTQAFEQRVSFETPSSRDASNRDEAKRKGFVGMPAFDVGGNTYFGALTDESWQAIFYPKPKKGPTHV